MHTLITSNRNTLYIAPKVLNIHVGYKYKTLVIKCYLQCYLRHTFHDNHYGNIAHVSDTSRKTKNCSDGKCMRTHYGKYHLNIK